LVSLDELDTHCSRNLAKILFKKNLKRTIQENCNSSTLKALIEGKPETKT